MSPPWLTNRSSVGNGRISQYPSPMEKSPSSSTRAFCLRVISAKASLPSTPWPPPSKMNRMNRSMSAALAMSAPAGMSRIG